MTAPVYDRDVLVEVVIYHHKHRIEGCACGWAELGKCHGQHVADVYEESVAARAAAVAAPVAGNVLAWQICTGCALTRELLVTLDEAKRLQALSIAEQEQHDGCYPRDGATRSRWLTNGARWAPNGPSSPSAFRPGRDVTL